MNEVILDIQHLQFVKENIGDINELMSKGYEIIDKYISSKHMCKDSVSNQYLGSGYIVCYALFQEDADPRDKLMKEGDK